MNDRPQYWDPNIYHRLEAAEAVCRSLLADQEDDGSSAWLGDPGKCPYLLPPAERPEDWDGCHICRDEPLCQTNEPTEGWPSSLLRRWAEQALAEGKGN